MCNSYCVAVSAHFRTHCSLTCSVRPSGSLRSSLMRPSSWQLSYRKPSSSFRLTWSECCRRKDQASMRHLEKHNGWLLKAGWEFWKSHKNHIYAFFLKTSHTSSIVEYSAFALTCCVAGQRDTIWPGRWRKLGALLCGSIVVPRSVGPGTSALAGHAHAATQSDTGWLLDAGAVQMNSNQETKED